MSTESAGSQAFKAITAGLGIALALGMGFYWAVVIIAKVGNFLFGIER